MLTDHTNLVVPIEPDELEMLQRVFDKACATRGAAKTSERAEAIAATIIGEITSPRRGFQATAGAFGTWQGLLGSKEPCARP